MSIKYLHTMIRVYDLDASLNFFEKGLGLKVSRKKDNPEGKFSLVFLSTGEPDAPEIELTHNWNQEEAYSVGRNFGHMAFVRSPDLISIELLQKGAALPPQEPWLSAKNIGEW
jgi:lactoylglutathione lyase